MKRLEFPKRNQDLAEFAQRLPLLGVGDYQEMAAASGESSNGMALSGYDQMGAAIFACIGGLLRCAAVLCDPTASPADKQSAQERASAHLTNASVACSRRT